MSINLISKKRSFSLEQKVLLISFSSILSIILYYLFQKKALFLLTPLVILAFFLGFFYIYWSMNLKIEKYLLVILQIPLGILLYFKIDNYVQSIILFTFYNCIIMYTQRWFILSSEKSCSSTRIFFIFSSSIFPNLKSALTTSGL